MHVACFIDFMQVDRGNLVGMSIDMESLRICLLTTQDLDVGHRRNWQA